MSHLLLPHPNDEKVKREIMSLFHKWISKQLVSLVVKYWHVDGDGKPKGKAFVTAASGTVLSIGDMWFYVTAGHVLKDLNELVGHRSVKVEQSFFLDSLGFDARHDHLIPFDYAESARHWVYEGGSDYGLVVLTANERRLMQANGVLATPLSDWLSHDVEKCESFALLGLPSEYVRMEEREVEGIHTGSVLMSLRRMRRLPKGAEKMPNRRFVGKILKIGNLRSIEGMSGGPIFGIQKRDGQYYTYVVAIQSKCQGNKYVFGCPTKAVGESIRGVIEDIVADVLAGAEPKPNGG